MGLQTGHGEGTKEVSRHMINISLRTKIMMVIGGVVIMSSFAMLIFVRTAVSQKLFDKLQKSGLSIAVQLAENGVNAILTEKFYALEMMLKDYRSREADIEYIFVLDDRGDVLAHTFEKGFPVDLKRINIIGAGQAYSIQSLKTGAGDILDIAVPILRGETGVVHLGISQSHILKDINEIIMFMNLIILAVMASGLIAAIVLSGTITKPVSELTRAVKEFGSGDLGRRVNISSNDEIGQLSGSFNNMASELKNRTDELERINSELTILHVISTAATSTMELDELYAAVLYISTTFKIFKSEHKGVIFIINNDKMNLVSQIGFTDSFETAHKGMKVGECLCGLAAKTGELIISRNSGEDERHNIAYPGMVPHGHICIPLEARDRILGVLCIYPPAGTELSERETALFKTIGSRIGAAIDNIMLHEETKTLSLHDPLTGLANRRLMEYVLESSFARAKRAESPFSAIMLDIDFFKQYNDTYGHAVGDNMLVEIARIISKEIRQIDLGIRYGGEEFLIILPETEMSEAYEVAERIRKEVEARTGVTVSLGVSCYSHEIRKKEEVVYKADDALLRAKKKGKNRTEVDGQTE